MANITITFDATKSDATPIITTGINTERITMSNFLNELSYATDAVIVFVFALRDSLALSKIADQMIVISFIGFLSNLAASFIFRMARGDKNEA